MEWRFGNAPTSNLCICLLLARSAFPDRLYTLGGTFGRSEPWLSAVFNNLAVHTAQQFGGLLAWHPRLWSYNCLLAFGDAVGRYTNLGGQRIWGFIDGTFRPFCRPTEGQETWYSGHAKAHGMKFQAITTPDSLVSSLIRPFSGPIND